MNIFNVVLMTYFEILGNIDKILQNKTDEIIMKYLYFTKFFVPLTFIKTKLKENMKLRFIAKNSTIMIEKK